MTIVILETRIDSGAMQGVPDTRAVTLWITNGTTNYITQRGNLPLTGDLLPALVADEANIWNDAVAGGLVATKAETAEAELEQWLIDNPGARAIFDLSKTTLEGEIAALVDSLFSGKPAADRTKMKRLLMGNTLVSRRSTAAG